MTNPTDYSPTELARILAEAGTLILDEGDALEGTLIAVKMIHDLGGYAGRYPALYVEREDGTIVRWIAVHTVARSELSSLSPPLQIGERFAVVRGEDADSEKYGSYRTYSFARASETEGEVDWSGITNPDEDSMAEDVS